ncbi:lysophospholipid acyltransferase family protein [Roseateles terrae]|uniref:1-acyl-sn-glycerol-3-phosphate acyltransferase n=1 Tax=Roseateles terrae TaxID=431060 RepID=A0ABR6GYP9_9BURK|nr:lysophospholipid acyltransferase family protein [Roseateles terrae]MBB3197241.1 1-acyl-sn-glycerol-3-phosphate acyltransferase [Roseateles terrae]OWQ83696.1 1-acyl-sn-glycerol-3-phosphate acyltransferase [Roseateles terrae]
MLAALRSLLFVLWLAVTVIPWGTAVVLVSPFLSSTRLYWMCAGWLTVAMWGARVICGVRWKVQGMEHLPKGPRESVILLSKHQSTWETFAYPMLMPRPLAYVFKRELIYVPFFGWAMARLDMIHIDRSKRSEAWSKVAAQGKRLAAQGTWVIMFPEGTRVARGTAGDYKTGGTRLAVETGQPVVPIAVNSARCWPRKSFLLRPGVVDISVGPQIPSTGRAPAELMQEVQAWIEAEMRRLDPDAYPASAPAPVTAPPAPAPV